MRKFILLWIALIPFIALAQFQQVGQTLEGLGLNEGYSTDLFGYNTALSGDGSTLAVAAIGSDVMVDGEFYFNTINYVQVFRMIDGEWQQIGENIQGLYDPQFNSYSRVGKGLAFSEDGNTLVVGETYYRETLEDGTYLNGGRVRVFKFENEDWTQIGNDILKIQLSTVDFGEYIDINDAGDVIVIGFPNEVIDNYSAYGSVAVYQNINNQWVSKGETIYGNNPFTYLGYGVSLSGDGNRMAVGIGDGPLQIFQASVRIYDFINNEWTWTETLSREYLAEEYTAMDISLSGNGKRLAIGNSGFPLIFFPTPPDSHYGHITIFEENEDNEWEHIQTIDGQYFEFIGFSVDLSWDGKVLASSPYIGDENKIFKETDGEWNHIGSVIRGAEDDWNTMRMPNSRDGSVVALGNFRTEPHGEAYAYQNCEFSEIDVQIAESASVCAGGTTVLTASVLPELYATTGSIHWYDSEFGTTPIFIGNEFETPPLSESTTYWVEAVTAGGCASVRLPVEAILYPTPELEIENPEVEICLGSDAYLYAFSEGNVIFWYAEEDDTEYLYHGNNFIVEGLTETTTFWVEAYNLNTGCVSERIPVTVTVTPVADISAEETEFEICAGNTATLSAASDSTVNWYDTADGAEPIFSGEEFTTPILNSTTHYWAEASGEGECVSGRIEFTVNVNASPDVPEAQPIQAYVEGMILADFEVEHTGTLHWYADEELTVELPDTTPVVIHTTYYVTQSLGDCESEATEIMADNFLNTGNPVKDEFAYYPNPVRDRLNFKGSEKVQSVQIFDMSGRLMIDQTSRNSGIEQLDVSSLPKGSYVVKAQTEKGMKTFKIIKN